MMNDKVTVTKEAMMAVVEDFLNNREELEAVAEDIVDLVVRKNHDYGDAWQRYGIFTPLIRINDKLLRVKTLTENGGQALVADEGVMDTMRDIFGYALLCILRLMYEAKKVDIEQKFIPLTGFERVLRTLLSDETKEDENPSQVLLKKCLEWQMWFLEAPMEDINTHNNEPVDSAILIRDIRALCPELMGEDFALIFNYVRRCERMG